MQINITKKSLMQRVCHPQFWGFFVSIAVMAIVSLAFFAPDNFAGNTLEQADMQQGAANGEEARAWEEATGEKALWTNSLFGGMPTFQISPSYPSNALFTWLNSVYGLGLPTPSNLLFMMMLGMLIMLYCMRTRWYYALLGAIAWGFSSYFIIIIGAGHIWKFLALTYVPPVLGGLMMAYRGRWLSGGALMALFAMLQLNANHPQITYYSAFIMAALVIGYLVQAIRNKKIKTWLAASATCLVAGALALGANSPSLYNTYLYSKETKRAQSELAEPAAANADTPKERPTGGLPKAEIGGWSNTPDESLSLLIPNIKGGANIKPVKGQNTGLVLGDLPEYQQDWGMQNADMLGAIAGSGQYFGGKEMTNGPFYVGALIFALFLLGCFIVRGPVKWGFLAVTIFSVLLAMGNHFELLTDFMIYNFPMYNKFRAAETALVIAALCMPCLGALALQKLFTTENAFKRYQTAIYISFGVPIFICLIAWLAPGLFGPELSAGETQMFDEALKANATNSQMVSAIETAREYIMQLREGLVSTDALRSLFVLLIGSAIVVYTTYKPNVPRSMATMAVALVVLIDLYSVDKRYIDSESFVVPEAVSPLTADEYDNAIMQDKDDYRVADLVHFGDARRSYFHHMVGGYHAAKLNRYNDLIEHRMGHVLSQQDYYPELREDSIAAQYPAEQQPIIKELLADYRVLDMLNTRYIIGKEGLYENPDALGNGWFVDKVNYVDGARAEMDALGTLNPATEAVADRQFADVLGPEVPSTVPGDTVLLTKYSPNQLTYDVTTKNGGVAVFSEVWFPWGWTATIDGKVAPLGRVNYVLRALRVPAGSHKVVMTFDPESLHTTGSMAYASVSLIYLIVLLAVFVAFNKKDEQTA